MADFSPIGFYFITARFECYRDRMKLYVIPAWGCFNFDYFGEVVRIEPLPFGEYGIAVELIRAGNPVFYTSNADELAFRKHPDGKDNIFARDSGGRPRP
jgi:hypothetical protein